MRIISQRRRVDKAAQHYGLPSPVINAHLDKEGAAIAGAVVEVDGTLIVPAVGQESAVCITQ